MVSGTHELCDIRLAKVVESYRNSLRNVCVVYGEHVVALDSTGETFGSPGAFIDT